MDRIRAGALCLLIAGCASAPPPSLEPAVFRGPEVSEGFARYSAWFADERDGVVYFGLSDFWSAFWATGDPLAELRDPGAQLIGRFDLSSESFKTPLVVRRSGPEVRASVWDVLAHPNGWVYYTTFYEEMGRVNPKTGEVERFSELGRGLNELALGPQGRIYATRYGSGLDSPNGNTDGALVLMSEAGLKLRELRLHARDGAVTAAKSVAVDPRSGHVFVNADVIRPGAEVEFARFELDASLSLVHGSVGETELLFIAFTDGGRGISVEDEGGRLRLTIRDFARAPTSLDLGPRAVQDFAQDIHFAPDGTAAIAFWSGRIELVRERGDRVEGARIDPVKPGDCEPPTGRSLLYSAFVTERAVYATLYCGATILRAPLPKAWAPLAPAD